MRKIGYTCIFIGSLTILFLMVYAFLLSFDKIHFLFYGISIILICSGTSIVILQDQIALRKKKARYLFVTGLFTIAIGYFCIKNFNRDLAGWLIVIGVFIMAFAYMPILTKNRIDKWTEYTKTKWLSVFLSIGDLLSLNALIIGTLFKIMHWPWADKLLYFGIVTLSICIIFWNRLLGSQIVLRKQAEDKTRETLAKLEEKSKEVEDSIRYAKRLQEAILPPNEFVNKHNPENFILYKPKDLVAGDFYWAEKIGANFYIAAADSTGHGVPGALVSVVCSNALNRSVKEFKETETGKILDKTRELVLETFEKSISEVKDGMDISLLCIDSKNKKITWSGANNSLWYFEENKLNEIKPDKQTIGKTDYQKPFTTHEIKFKYGSTFYLFTDGFADQFGGPNGKKYKYKQFSELLASIVNLNPEQQNNLIAEAFEGWKGELEQVDDICIIGIRV